MHDLLGNFGMNTNIAVHDLRDLKVYTQAHDVDGLHCRHTSHHHTNDHTEAMYGMCVKVYINTRMNQGQRQGYC